MNWLLVISICIALTGFYAAMEQRRLQFVGRRRSHRKLWMNAFKPTDQRRVDQMLEVICEALMIPKRNRFRLRPSDDIHELYRCNMVGQLADSLEFEALVTQVRIRFGIVAGELVAKHPCTIGNLVRQVGRPRCQS